MRWSQFVVVPAISAGLLVALVPRTSTSAAASQAPAAQTAPTGPAARAAPGAAGAPRQAARAEDAEVARLARELRGILREPGWEGARHGVLVVSLDRGDTLFSLNPDLPLAPASNLKLYSTAAALYYLGPDFRYSTYLLADGPVEDGVLRGDLLLYGTGDPAMSGRLLPGSTSALRALADTLASRGVREVTGDLVGDGSYFDNQWIGEGWKEADRMSWYAAPVGALGVAENLVTLRVVPGAVGGPARVSTSPGTRELAVVNRVRTVAGSGASVQFAHGEQTVVLTGSIGRGHAGVVRGVPVTDPANYAAAVLRDLLADRGIQVRGRVREVEDPTGSRVGLAGSATGGADPPRVLAVHLSPPLTELITVTNHVSHNLFADALLKTVGRVALGEGTFAGGARAVQYFLECETGADTARFRVVDGSGLSRFNRTTARITVQLLDYMARSGTEEAYRLSLPEAADPRGLRRMQGTAAAGNLRAKTGTIQHVSSLSGYVLAADGERLAFSIIANDVPSPARAKRMEDAIGARLASFRRADAHGTPRLLGDAAPASGAASSGSTADAATRTGDSAAGTVSGETTAPGRSTAAPGNAAPARPRETAGPATTRTAESSDPAPASGKGRTHRVRQGETMDAIARRNGVTLQELRRANPGVTPRRLQVGEELRIPR